MFNSEIPPRDELPSAAQLVRSTIIAILAAIAILVTAVLPAEHGIDPTGIGRLLQLTEMGKIKKQLAEEAETDRRREREQVPTAPGPRSSLSSILAGALFSPAYAADRPVLVAQASAAASDETVIILRPSEGVEWKFRAERGAQIRYSWSTEGGVVNYEMHGTRAASRDESSYKSGRGIARDEGVLTAGFDGTHGWFFRNRGNQPVKIMLRTSGAYTDLKRM